MQMDLPVSSGNRRKFRKDWGLQNVVGMSAANPVLEKNDAHRQRIVQQRIENFVKRAVFPQQLTLPRQYATTREGTFIFKVLVGRKIDGIQEQGARVVVQENAQQARFVMSPLFASKHDARAWARQHMAAQE